MSTRLSLRRGAVVLLTATVVLFGAGAATRTSTVQQEFEEADIFLELNDTDGDLGLHASIDGEEWTNLEITDPNATRLLSLLARNALRKQGLTQLFFESAEPSFDELPAAEFLARFPEGVYRFEARALEGGTITGRDRLSHVLAAPVSNITVNGQPLPPSCDDGPLPVVTPPVVVDWDPVKTSHPTIGKPGPVEIALYQVFVERNNVNLGVDLPPRVTELDLPKQVTALGAQFKLEIIARTSTGNNTAVETCFRVQ
jgi:hypothetical protein